MESPVCGSLPPDLKLIETLRLLPSGPLRGARHLSRMARSAAELGIAFDAGEAAQLLDAARVSCALRARLTLDLHGRLDLTCAPLTPAPEIWRVAWASERVTAADRWRRVKSTERGLYDRARAALPEGCEEVLFLNEAGRLCEGSITSVFLETGEGLLTPPVDDGALPGILREELIARGIARTRSLTPEDLSGRRLYVGNSLRGLRAARFEGAPDR
ncbi:aminotransferase class IV [Palleronia caenipelagi]|uniref:Probable branched-chain-amino-acid aminotransferase n=1 Tax=Palleronia caenipelagi TaxID=2489174 RepID=A0A547Q674_9RHOB|nr:aminotransferase class IV [Palleronia caenipelagi]TRD21860.1 4-amino-4-deoxychorismate lyase [Palleronia caenipelagi]